MRRLRLNHTITLLDPLLFHKHYYLWMGRYGATPDANDGPWQEAQNLEEQNPKRDQCIVGSFLNSVDRIQYD